MKRVNANVSKREYAARREARAAWKAERADAVARREQASLDALARYAPRSNVHAAPVCPGDAARLVLRRAPRLGIEPYVTAISRLMTAAPLRSDWVPSGRGRATLFRSLAAHQLARHPMPTVLWTVFFDPFLPALVPLVAHVAAGGSLYEYARDTGFPIPLSRRMCHELLATPFRGHLFHAIRRVEVRSVGGDDTLYAAWMRTRVAQELGTRDDERFWLGVLAWLAKVPLLDASRIGPLVDYISFRKREDGAFSLQGRTVASLTRGMADWHRDLARERDLRGTIFQPSGFSPIEIEVKQRDPTGGIHKGVWRVGEILSSKDLLAEGRRMGHCVFSYARDIESGQTSIWSMTLEDGRGATGTWAMLTIEVRNELRRVVQARGRFNRQPTNAEHQILVRWAGVNRLTMAL